MSWLRLEDNMLDHPKWRRALRMGGDEVVATWVRLVSWCSRNLTDGRVPADMVAQVAEVRSVERSRALRALADAGLISFSHPTDAGLTAVSRDSDVLVTDYLERNASREEVLSMRRRKSQSQRLRRHRGTEAGLQKTSEAACNFAPSHPIPSHPNPSPIGTPSKGVPLARQEASPAPASGAPHSTPKAKPKSVTTLLPDDFAPTAEHATIARERGLDLRDQFERMRDWALSKAVRKADWNATFRNWLRRSNDEPRVSHVRSATPKDDAMNYLMRVAQGDSP